MTTAPCGNLTNCWACGRGLADVVSIPQFLPPAMLFTLGDPISASVPAYQKMAGTDGDFEQRASDHHDGMEWFGLKRQWLARRQRHRAWPARDEPQTTTTDEKLSPFLPAPTAASPAPPARRGGQGSRHPRRCRDRSGQHGWQSGLTRLARPELPPDSLTPIDISGPRAAARSSSPVLAHRRQDTRHAEQLRHGQDPCRHLPDGREKLVWLLHPRRCRRRSPWQRQERDVFEAYMPRQGAASRHGWETGGTDDKVRSAGTTASWHSWWTAATTIATK